VGLDPRDRVLSGIECSLRTAKDFRCDVVFVKPVGFSGEAFLPHISEQVGQPRPPSQRFYNTLQFGPLCLDMLAVGMLRHHCNSKEFSVQLFVKPDDTNCGSWKLVSVLQRYSKIVRGHILISGAMNAILNEARRRRGIGGEATQCGAPDVISDSS